MAIDDIIKHLRRIASRGYTTDEDNQWLFDVADFLEGISQEMERSWQ